MRNEYDNVNESDKKHAELDGEPEAVAYSSAGIKSSGRRRGLIVVSAAALVLLAVALGLGLGLGLRKHHHSNSTSTTPTAANGTSNSSTSALSAVMQQPSSNFVLRGAAAMRSEPAQTRTYQFVVEERMGSPDGFSKKMLVVNGMFPGPTIEANQGDRIVVNVTNKLPNPTAIHWHGLFQPLTPFYDGTAAVTQCGIPPGESLVYNFTLGDFFGTTWWHSHYSTQYTDGIAGALIIHGTNETVPASDGEVVVQMNDLYHTFSTDLLELYLSPPGITGQGDTGAAQGDEPVPDSGTINGVGQWGSTNASYANYTLAPGKTYRLRLVNSASFSAIRFSVDNHVLTVIEADGTPIVPYNVTGLDIEVAQRYSVLLTTNKAPGAYWMRSLVSQDSYTYVQPDGQYNQLAVIRYGAADDALPNSASISLDPGSGTNSISDMDITSLVPAVYVTAPNATVSYLVSVSMQETPSGVWRSFVNSTSWSPLQGQASMFSGLGFTTTGAKTYNDSQLIVSVPELGTGSKQLPQVVDIIINNYDDGDHSFHLHGNKFWIVGSGNGRYQNQNLNNANPLYRDTTLLSAYTWTVLRFVADNPGMWMFHCHLSWHMAAGLAMQWLVQPSQIPNPPQVMLAQCATMSVGFLALYPVCNKYARCSVCSNGVFTS
ncbi:BQ5605_C016g08067 [Microbotryum silenes-dioicae]|uniref:BQ5605_C016g08067 protein n=1 Tax=Microbotryum silenes-dioicae TaxID=796604 RepID=A0A2X0MGZ1_9BASI|nr:BQ5605_C016g08067 [Microbotryum silenes-dioicae]